MPHLLHIESAIVGASVCLSLNERPIAQLQTETQKDTAAWLHVAIRDLLQDAGLKPAGLAAVSVSMGPGSYTGLRVGFSAAKGLCYALRIPLIAVGTLDALFDAGTHLEEDVRVPMIDARRMEVFTAGYHRDGQPAFPYSNLVLDATSFSELQGTVAFYGTGAGKFQAICNHPHARFHEVAFRARDLVQRAWKRFQVEDFSDLAYSEPFYGKDFYSLTKYSL